MKKYAALILSLVLLLSTISCGPAMPPPSTTPTPRETVPTPRESPRSAIISKWEIIEGRLPWGITSTLTQGMEFFEDGTVIVDSTVGEYKIVNNDRLIVELPYYEPILFEFSISHEQLTVVTVERNIACKLRRAK